ncbi:unnamed protein product [Heligmosomoides polygyrus]|uniref:Uncharacterized protein n=1 Tax=Heligmosomoides polygyrus TaxID=6339 RepID=A0A183FET2_HELPZ|nr:unnamed protein product [Heligmosomoides polygyrus]
MRAPTGLGTCSFCEIHTGILRESLPSLLDEGLLAMDFAVWGCLQQKKAWDDIDVTFLRPTVMSVEKRLKACIAAKRAHFVPLLKLCKRRNSPKREPNKEERNSLG